jgi:hypothetical protein
MTSSARRSNVRQHVARDRERWLRAGAEDPQAYTEPAPQVAQVAPDADGATLRVDAVDVVQRFLGALGISATTDCDCRHMRR